MRKYIRTYQLVTHSQMRNKESFFHVTLMADFLLKCLKMTNYFGAVDTNPLSGDYSDVKRMKLMIAQSWWQFQFGLDGAIHFQRAFPCWVRSRYFEETDRLTK